MTGASRESRLDRGAHDIEQPSMSVLLRIFSEAEPAPDPDPVLADLHVISRRALAGARDNLAEVRKQYEQAARQARANGWNRAEIARVLGVSRQLLHKRFRNQPHD
ncbi:hypothetical protein [Mycobacterium sp. OTB74]|uniref:hypothetical protein n=1 Tax=Mycobacterium sp. OTB74 TaxID=1853452 RepID=UPI0024749FF8|nr:hypothetical protein [Mycobacterium sp. OTB74]MDH6245605.1 DNA-directed RNA polymerase specialized sigma24 family protein [Mycobacterium sp. OTB74]